MKQETLTANILVEPIIHSIVFHAVVKQNFHSQLKQIYLALYFWQKISTFFLPDMILIKRGSKFISVSYESAQPSIHRTTIQEPKSHPGDARVIDYTYQYVNKSGGPDRRFKINPKIPICSYGELTFKSTENLNIRIQFSNDSFVESISTDKSV